MPDPQSWQDLRDRFLDLVADSPPTRVGLWLEVWRLFLEHPWYQSELAGIARRLVERRRLPPDWREEVEQDAALLLARSLRHAPDLHVDRARAEAHFPGWLATIITRDCLQALRRLRARHGRTLPLKARDLETGYDAHLERRVEVSQAVDGLAEPQRTVLHLYAKGLTVQEVADALGLSPSKAYRVLQKGLEELRSRLSGP